MAILRHKLLLTINEERLSNKEGHLKMRLNLSFYSRRKERRKLLINTERIHTRLSSMKMVKKSFQKRRKRKNPSNTDLLLKDHLKRGYNSQTKKGEGWH